MYLQCFTALLTYFIVGSEFGLKRIFAELHEGLSTLQVDVGREEEGRCGTSSTTVQLTKVLPHCHHLCTVHTAHKIMIEAAVKAEDLVPTWSNVKPKL